MGLTQTQFAQRIYRDKSTISKIESSEIELSPSMRSAICNEFGVREEWILTGKGEKFKREQVEEYKDAETVKGTIQSEFRVSEALTMCARVLESGTSYATALYLNIQHFERAVAAEERITIVEKQQADIESRNRAFEQKMQAEFLEMKRMMGELRQENQSLRTEVNRLKSTHEVPDGGEGSLADTNSSK